MKRILITIFMVFVFFEKSEICCMQDDSQLATELERAIINRDLQIITLTRPSTIPDMRVLFPIEITYLFRKLQILFNTKKEIMVDESFHNEFMRRLSDIEKGLKINDIDEGFEYLISEKKKACMTLDKYLSTIKPVDFGKLSKLNSSKWTILVFQEAFFSKMHALDNYMVKAIVEYCNKLTINNPKLIIVVNFLHEFEDEKRLPWLLDYMPSEKCFASTSILINENTPLLFPYHHHIRKQAAEEIIYTPLFVSGNQKPKDFCLQGEHRLANYSLVIHKGIPIAVYRKSFYTEEKNSLIDKGYVYEFGDFIVHPTPRVAHSPFFDILFNPAHQICRMFICGDLNIGLYQAKDLVFSENISPLSLVASNSISLSSSQISVEPLLRNIFAQSSLIIHSDCRFGPFVGYMMGSDIMAYIPISTNLMVQKGAFTKNAEYFLLKGTRIHTGIYGCTFGVKNCILNVWDLCEGRSMRYGFLGKSVSDPIRLVNFGS
jgi:hypothetical protein